MSIVPHQIAPWWSTLPSFMRFPGRCGSGSWQGPISSGSSVIRATPLRKPPRRPPSPWAATQPSGSGMVQRVIAPLARSSRLSAGARMSVQYKAPSRGHHSVPSPSVSAISRSTLRQSVIPASVTS
jgi:hypothetical protein